MFHVTERLLLRPFWPEDWDQVLAGVGEKAIACNLARVPWPYTEDDARWWTSQPQDPRLPAFAVIESRSGALIGAAGLGRKTGSVEVELGYWLARSHWGRGLATEAGRGVIEVARMLGIRRVVAGHFADNPASGRVLRKLGFGGPQAARRYSLARGCEVQSLEYVLELGEPAQPVMQAA
ncbi:GNAT family N-acetyltransferase [Tsuneonella sp. YG55]|uniref:GNAT family N-acetyltransferase n=1 Tax=Tsuneonella litorea TaxID=2976475 RepID=A0A9X2W0L1_9SPHN|nr:GNAT family N-acetyltransferase [Tsuneonella litorea]MCT2558517.1 GNAT family N-acetyltransferase [Tsuneonella litorea]